MHDVSEFPKDSGCIFMIGNKFTTLVDAFDEPYRSSEYQTYIASNLSRKTREWNINMIKSKVYALPYKLERNLYLRCIPKVVCYPSSSHSLLANVNR